MSLYALFSLLVLFAVIIYYINMRFFRIQPTIAITLGALVFSAILVLVDHWLHTGYVMLIDHWLLQIDFRSWLLNGALGLFLFAGALTVNLRVLLKHRWEVGTLALFGTAASTFLVGTGLFYLLAWLGLDMPYLYCLLFGAIISPTDPIAVLATVKQMRASEDLTTKIAGESLFNDGVGLVIFVTLLSMIMFHGHPTWQSVSLLFIREAVGGILFGLVLGYVGYWLIKPIPDAKLEILLTLCIASTGYVFAQWIGISGPLAMVVSGLIIGNVVRQHAMTEHGQQHLDTFWEVVDELLNALLFLLIGMEVLMLHGNVWLIVAGLIAIPMVLAIRFLTVAVPMSLFRRYRQYVPFVITILTWGGLRGGLALAMALSVPQGPYRDPILLLTYMVVIFSIVVQGLTAKSLVKKAASTG